MKIVALNMAIVALRFRTPKKPTSKGIGYPDYCTVCDLKIMFRDRSNYCPNCGQALDWRDSK